MCSSDECLFPLHGHCKKKWSRPSRNRSDFWLKMNKSSLEAAAEAAARVNAMLIAKGKLKLPPSQFKPKISSSGRSLCGDLITAEVDINDAPLSARNLLTRGHMQDEICKYSGAAISTRGRYMTLEERQNISTPDCRPLYLHIQASSPDAVNCAVKKIQELINQHIKATGGTKSSTVGVVTYPTSNANGSTNPMLSVTSQPLPSGPHFVQDKVFVGLENAPANYPVREKILGPSGSFLQHIRTETGANVTLRGKGSGFIEPTSGREAFEPLYIHVTHPKIEGLQAAKALAINLVETAHVEFAQWQQQQQQIPQRSVLQSIVIPQATQIAYRNQVVVTPTVLPATAGAIATALPMPTSSVAGAALQSVPQLVQAPMNAVPPVSVVTSIPVSVQGVPSQAVISYPTTYVANHNAAIARAPPAVSGIVGVVSSLPVSATYTAATSQHTFVSSHTGTLPVAQFTAPVQTLTLPQSLAYGTVPTSQTHLTPPPQSMVLSPNAVSYSTMPQTYVTSNPPPLSSVSIATVNPVVPVGVVPVVSTAYHHLEYTRPSVDPQKKFYINQEVCVQDSRPSLQEFNSNHPTENGDQRLESMAARSSMPGSQDSDLMPPPPKPVVKDLPNKRGASKSSESEEPEKKKLRGALIGIASVYGSDDSSDDESTAPSIDSSSHSKSYASFHSNKPLM